MGSGVLVKVLPETEHVPAEFSVLIFLDNKLSPRVLQNVLLQNKKSVKLISIERTYLLKNTSKPGETCL